MPNYEHVFIARQEISPQQVDALTQQFTEIIANQGGSVKKTENWGLRNLAYKIKKNRKGHYVLMNIEADPKAVAEMERVSRLNDDVIRSMTIRVDALEEGPSAMMQSRSGGREERGGGRRDGGGRFRRSFGDDEGDDRPRGRDNRDNDDDRSNGGDE